MTDIKRPLAISQMTKVSFEMYKLTAARHCDAGLLASRSLPVVVVRGLSCRQSDCLWFAVMDPLPGVVDKRRSVAAKTPNSCCEKPGFRKRVIFGSGCMDCVEVFWLDSFSGGDSLGPCRKARQR